MRLRQEITGTRGSQNPGKRRDEKLGVSQQLPERVCHNYAQSLRRELAE
jgi:hypothetical protein